MKAKEIDWTEVNAKYDEYVNNTHPVLTMDFRTWIQEFYFVPTHKFGN